MRLGIPLGIAAIAVAGAGVYWYAAQPAEKAVAKAEEAIPVSTVPGMMLQPLARQQGYGHGGPGMLRIGDRIVVFTDLAGMTLYTSDKDTSGKSNCAGDCAKSWHAAIVPAYAKAAGDLSLIAREDGSRQWAFKGKPLYAFSGDKMVGDSKGDKAEDGNWHSAVITPTVMTPPGISVAEVADAEGFVLVNAADMTLYSFDRSAENDLICADGPCVEQWLPVRAPEVANPVGDFTVIDRQDGISQWAYKGRPLYSWSGDLEVGDVNGGNPDTHEHVAYILRHFRPTGIKIQPSLSSGKILTDDKGMTLYRRDAFRQEVGIHGLAHGVNALPAIGRSIGTRGCDAECRKTWHPVAAPADAQPSGYWDIAVREDDGTRQWVYKGYALYRYDGDKKPGDMNGNDIYDYMTKVGVNKTPDIPPNLQQIGAGGIYWTFTQP